jgi:hypothetical protein
MQVRDTAMVRNASVICNVKIVCGARTDRIESARGARARRCEHIGDEAERPPPETTQQ